MGKYRTDVDQLCKQSKYPRRDSVNAGAEHEVVNFVEIKHEVEAETEVGTADKLDSRNDGAVKVTTRCDSCAATFQLYISKGDCHTAMDKMCDSVSVHCLRQWVFSITTNFCSTVLQG